MTKYEYECHKIECTTLIILCSELQAFGANGWRLHTIIDHSIEYPSGDNENDKAVNTYTVLLERECDREALHSPAAYVPVHHRKINKEDQSNYED